MIKKLTNKGFTLTEMMVVVVIIAILAAFAMPQYFTHVGIAESKEAVDFLRQWQAARLIRFAETQSYDARHGLRVLAFDNPTIYDDENGWHSVFTKFICDSILLSDDQTAAAACVKRGDDAFTIVARETAMYCCWNTNTHPRSSKICDAISSGGIVNNFPQVGVGNYNSCYLVDND